MFATQQRQDEIDDLTEEELQHLATIELQQEERKRQLYEKQVQEEEMKREQKMKARQQLEQWEKERQQQTQLRQKLNLENEESFKERQSSSAYSNPWQRVIDNCEMQAAQYVGGEDVSRMRSAMIARKNDMTKQGGGAAN